MTTQFTRRGLLKGSVAASAAAFTAFALGSTPLMSTSVLAAPPLDDDLQILNYALTLEHLESAAYKAVLGMNVLTGRALTYFTAFGAHEVTHVDAITMTIRQLGGTPVSPATYNFSSVPKDQAGIIAFFQNVESVGASAYLGAAGSIKAIPVLDAALSIHAVEAEHASALADLVMPGGELFAPEAFATPRTPDQVMQIVAPFFMAQAAATGTGGGTAATATRAATAAPTATPANVPAAAPRTGGGGGRFYIGALGEG